jgi:hypothetical protein
VLVLVPVLVPVPAAVVVWVAVVVIRPGGLGETSLLTASGPGAARAELARAENPDPGDTAAAGRAHVTPPPRT